MPNSAGENNAILQLDGVRSEKRRRDPETLCSQQVEHEEGFDLRRPFGPRRSFAQGI